VVAEEKIICMGEKNVKLKMFLRENERKIRARRGEPTVAVTGLQKPRLDERGLAISPLAFVTFLSSAKIYY
jgi:hypothetical protein